MVITGDDLPDTPAHRDANATAVAQGVFLVGLSSPFQGRCFPLSETTQIGRREHNDVVLDDPGISWEHAQILYSDGHWQVLNVLSTNGTFVNGEPVHEAELADRDEVTFGHVRFRFRCLEGDHHAAGETGGGRRRAVVLASLLVLVVGLAGLAVFVL